MDARYRGAKEAAKERGAEGNLEVFETALQASSAVIARPLKDLLRLAESDKELYASFYSLVEGEVRLPAGDKWDVLRRVADSALFPYYEKEIRFAALTLDGLGLKSYGNCFMMLKPEMIESRASVFEENSVLFMERHGIQMSEANALPKGYRATWGNRARLAAVKLGGSIDRSTSDADHASILVKQGGTTAEDDFIEVHIWGPFSVRTLERVTLLEGATMPGRAIIKRLIAKLKAVGVALEVS